MFGRKWRPTEEYVWLARFEVACTSENGAENGELPSIDTVMVDNALDALRKVGEGAPRES